MQTNDPINPNHYKEGDVECIEAIMSSLNTEAFHGYLKASVMKYLWRYRYKNGTEDLKKARWYLNKLIVEVEGCYDDES